MNITRKNFNEWDKNTKRKLRRATIPGGYMKMFTGLFPQSPTIVIFDQNNLVGWVLILPDAHKNGAPFLSVFINKRYRKQGVATLLIEEALRCFNRIALADWNDATHKLFSRLQEKYPDKIIVFDWWKNFNHYRNLVEDTQSSQ